MPLVTIDTTNPMPPFAQIRTLIRADIESGVLPSGSRLPPIRQLAGELGLAPGTVARAYSELEAAEFIETNRSKGTRVRAIPEARHAVHLAADAFIEVARSHGIDADTALAIVRARFDEDR